MKYVAILTYTTGSTTGMTIEADSLHEAWQKLLPVIPTAHLQSINLSEISTPDHEIR